MSAYETAIANLARTDTWCKGAEALTLLGDRRAIIPLLQAWERPTETSKICLLDALEDMHAVSDAPGMLQHGDPAIRRWGLVLMGLFPEDAFIPAITGMWFDPDPDVQAQAYTSLKKQYQTPAWETALTGLLEHPVPLVRYHAADALSVGDSEVIALAFKARKAVESDPDILALLSTWLQHH
ncbi:MAG: HEAT repeat domain-containing protein [Bacteroidia bacterium]|nr:HEAT repeat domain-containing protein [Bacteroidia bacterium]